VCYYYNQDPILEGVVFIMKSFNEWLGNKLAIFLSTMGCFYLVFALVVVPLFFAHPNDLVGWVQYVVQSIFQGIALPILGYVAKKSGDNQERVLNETHDTVMKEFVLIKEEMNLVKQELILAKEERNALTELMKEVHQQTKHV